MIVRSAGAAAGPLRQVCRRLHTGGNGRVLEAYVSTSDSPLFNLSLEEHLLRTRPSTLPLVLIYRNSPCIVIGRNQNPWKELNVASMRELQLPLVRRRSGGGAVYHDMGNTNFSFHVARESFERRMGAELIARALNGPDVGLRSLQVGQHVSPPGRFSEMGHGSQEGVVVNERHDLVVRVVAPDESKSGARALSARSWAERKISGSAFKILTHRAYHHGTMLLDSDLSALGSSLRNVRNAAMVSKGVESVKSPVTNLSTAYPDAAAKGLLSHERFAQAVVREFWKTYDASAGRDEAASLAESLPCTYIDETHPIALQPARQDLERDIGSWDWIFGQCPEFETVVALDAAQGSSAARLQQLGLNKATIWLRARNGLVVDAELKDDSGVSAQVDIWRPLIRGLVGQRWDALTDRPPLPTGVDIAASGLEAQGDASGASERKIALLRWLREAL
ncbi:unnamed protein product [Parajaminaea phylloscopi]